jgi:glycosyltransferase involved in cell wall biosynthesis
MAMSRQKWLCAQIGAREHFAVARALHRDQRLATLYTEFWAGRAVRKLAGSAGVGPMRFLAARFHPELAGADVQSWNWRALGREAGQRYRPCHDPWGPYSGFMDIGRRFSLRVRDALKRRSDVGSDSIFFSYDTGALEAMAWCRERGIRCVLNQIDPSRVEAALVREEAKRWPGWQPQPIEIPEAYFRRREQEWALADLVVVNSNFCRLALIEQGVPAEKLIVVPLCYERDCGTQGHGIAHEEPSPFDRAETLRVLWLGQVVLRKGIQYLIEAARLLDRENIHFDVVGPVGISQTVVAAAPRNLTFHGRVPRSEASAWYRRAGVFVLPTLSDGFAITQLEAMSHGLPVVATRCCGEVVEDGVDGLIVPPRDAGSLAKALRRYLVERGLVQHHGGAARQKAKQFSLDRLSGNLSLLEDCLDRT